MGIAFQGRTVHVGTRIAFIRIANHVLFTLGLASGKLPLEPRRESGTAATAKTGFGNNIHDVFGLHGGEDLLNCRIAIASDVIGYLLRINEAAVAQHNTNLLLVERNSHRSGKAFSLFVIVEQAVNDAPLHEMLVHNFLGVFRFYFYIEGVFGQDLNNRSLFAETKTSSTNELDILRDAGNLKFRFDKLFLEFFGNLVCATGIASRTAANQNILFESHGSILVSF